MSIFEKDNQRTEHRLLCDGKVIDSIGKQTIKVN
jgi:hypothetical protein